jgi:regulator of protease activity HflC (stomatin/prohibitin superfamily)
LKKNNYYSIKTTSDKKYSQKKMFSIKSLVICLSLCSLSTAFLAFTRIPEGHVGVYSINGQIQDKLITSTTFYNPPITWVEIVKYIQDSDLVIDTKCVSKEGVNVYIPKIEIANRIDKEKIIPIVKLYGYDYDTKLVVNPLAQYMRELCAARTVDEIEITDFHKLDDLLREEIQRQNDAINSGITIDYVRVATVDVPKEIKDKRLKLAEEKANKILAEEVMKRTEIEKSSEALVAKRDNERMIENANKANEMMIKNIEAEKQKKSVENSMALEATQTKVQQIKLEAVANAEKMELEAKALRELYNVPEYANVQKAQAISDKTVFYLGEKIPNNMFIGTPNQPMIPFQQ